MQPAVIDTFFKVDAHSAEHRQVPTPVVARVNVFGGDLHRIARSLVHGCLLTRIDCRLYSRWVSCIIGLVGGSVGTQTAPEHGQWASTLASLMTLPQTSVSFVMNALASAGDPPAAWRFILAKWSCTAGLLRISFTALLSFATTAGEVFGGAAIAFHVPDSKPLIPASSSVGMSGRLGIRLFVATARIRALPPSCNLIAEASSIKMKSTWLAMMSLSAGAVPL